MSTDDDFSDSTAWMDDVVLVSASFYEPSITYADCTVVCYTVPTAVELSEVPHGIPKG